MSFDSLAPANRLVSVLTSLSAVNSAQIGAPESVSTRLSAYVTMGSQGVGRKTTGTTQRQTRYFVMFVYRVDGDETAAETALMQTVDAFMAALYADLTLNGTGTDLEAASLAADEPEYQLRVGKEYREYPIVVTVTQQGTYEVNP
jgi:hypothetical protein